MIHTKDIKDLHSIGHGLDTSTGILYPMKESGGYDFENGCPLREADDLSMLSDKDKDTVWAEAISAGRLGSTGWLFG